MSYDSILKFLVEESPQVFVRWLLNEDINQKVEILNVELNLEPIRADGLFFSYLCRQNFTFRISE